MSKIQVGRQRWTTTIDAEPDHERCCVPSGPHQPLVATVEPRRRSSPCRRDTQLVPPVPESWTHGRQDQQQQPLPGTAVSLHTAATGFTRPRPSDKNGWVRVRAHRDQLSPEVGPESSPAVVRPATEALVGRRGSGGLRWVGGWMGMGGAFGCLFLCGPRLAVPCPRRFVQNTVHDSTDE